MNFYPQVYRVFFRKYSKDFKLPHQMSAVSNLITSARSSFASLPSRRNSNASILSALERRSSFQTGRRTSDSSVVSDIGINGRPSYSELTKREAMFSPIQEHIEDEASETESCTKISADCLDSSVTITVFMQFTDERKTIITHSKSAEV